MRSVFLPQRPHHQSALNPHYRNGYVDGKNSGIWTGAFVGFLLGSLFVAGVFALRAWSATL